MNSTISLPNLINDVFLYTFQKPPVLSELFPRSLSDLCVLSSFKANLVLFAPVSSYPTMFTPSSTSFWHLIITVLRAATNFFDKFSFYKNLISQCSPLDQPSSLFCISLNALIDNINALNSGANQFRMMTLTSLEKILRDLVFVPVVSLVSCLVLFCLCLVFFKVLSYRSTKMRVQILNLYAEISRLWLQRLLVDPKFAAVSRNFKNVELKSSATELLSLDDIQNICSEDLYSFRSDLTYSESSSMNYSDSDVVFTLTFKSLRYSLTRRHCWMFWLCLSFWFPFILLFW
ncbi:hypothetical protein GEMRC1_005806 [Eukaryota sp. GEM-RC1]